MKTLCRSLAGLGLSVLTASAFAGVTCQPTAPGEVYVGFLTSPGKISPYDGTCWVNGLTVTTRDGLKLTANVFLPKITSAGQKFPTVIMVNSWVMPDWEYIGQAQRLAKDGYIVLEYASRGWWQSEGMIGVASPDDTNDVSSVVDWLSGNVPTDMNNIAISGISYGAGISLLGLEKEPRIKTAAALSGWGSLVEELYFQDTPDKASTTLLVGVAPITGKPTEELKQIGKDLLNPDTTQPRVEEIKQWASIRSPLTDVAAINTRRAPVFLSKNYQDDMFTPNSSMKLFSQLQGPKKLLLNKGWHAAPELPGALLGIDNYQYDQVHRWFDYWLKGKDNGIMSEPQVDMEIENKSGRERLATWPAPNLQTQTLNIAPRGKIRWDWNCFCAKGDVGYLQSAGSSDTAVDSISNSYDTVANSGIPVLGNLLEGFGAAPIAWIPAVLRDNGVIYNGSALSSTLKLRGMPKVQLNVKPTGPKAQVVAYLYDVDVLGWGTLITHGVRSLHWATPGETVSFPIEMDMTAYNVAAGHHLALVVDTQDARYGAASNDWFGVDFMFASDKKSSLVLPYIN